MKQTAEERVVHLEKLIDEWFTAYTVYADALRQERPIEEVRAARTRYATAEGALMQERYR